MTSPWIDSLRSVALNVPDLGHAEAFYTRVWQLAVVTRSNDTIWLRGSGAYHHLLSLHAGGPQVQIRHVTLRARSLNGLHQIAKATATAGGTVLSDVAALTDDPAGGTGALLRDPHGRVLQVVHGDCLHADTAPQRDQPLRLAHVVLNSHDVPATQSFLEQALGFTLSDRTRAMAFLNCNRDHHSIALGVADNDALNHIAFVMPDLDAVMRGGGRMRDAGHPVQWGPGRHGPGDNAFNYFIDPFGVVIEYTAEIEQIDDSYRVGQPDDWTWPPGRVDQWGISSPPSAALKQAQRSVFFAPAAS